MAARKCTVCGVVARYLRPETGYACKACRKKNPTKTCKDCSKTEPDVAFRDRRGICNRCTAIRRGKNVSCSSCGADTHGSGAKKLCKPCAEKVRSNLKRQRKRGIESYQRLNTTLTYQEWVHSNCHMKKWVESQWRPVKIKPPKPRTAGMAKAEQWRWRYHNDPVFNLHQRLRASARKHHRFGCINTRIRDGMRGAGGKSAQVYALLGYTPDELKQHIERQFSKGMTWERFMAGEIHIDHVIPIKAHDLSKDEEVIRCWSLPNLQPLWAADNLRKGASAGRLV